MNEIGYIKLYSEKVKICNSRVFSLNWLESFSVRLSLYMSVEWSSYQETENEQMSK